MSQSRYDPNSMCLWWPKVAGLAVPRPETVIVDVGHDRLCDLLDGQDLPPMIWDEIRSAADRLGYPVFMRTDLSSGKHDYRDTCYVDSSEALERNLWALVEANLIADFIGLPCEAIVLRQYIPLATQFTAFSGSLPIAPERRYFVRDGLIACHHPYWPAEAIARSCFCDLDPCPALPSDWRTRLDEMNRPWRGEEATLNGYAALIANALPEFWSIDFALGNDHVWYFIDAARGERSWHPEECPHSEQPA